MYSLYDLETEYVGARLRYKVQEADPRARALFGVDEGNRKGDT